MRNKRSQEAYLLIDHRNSPGITAEFMQKNKIDGPAVGKGTYFESAMTVCHCCQADIVLNPNRSRDREWCMQHDAYLCDRCALTRRLTGSCVPLKQRIADIFNRLIKLGG
jgi:hypothetical protein